jgi:hypothetical protein
MKLSELISKIEQIRQAASLVGDDDPGLFFLVDKDDTKQVPVTEVYLAFDHDEQKGRLIFW